MRSVLCATILALASTTAGAQELTRSQHQVLGGIKKTLTECVQKLHANCDVNSNAVCDIEQVDVLDNVLKEWENTPDYGKYAVTMMDWQGNLDPAVSEMARKYVARHDHSDVGFENELHRRMGADPIFIRRKNTCVVTYSAPFRNAWRLLKLEVTEPQATEAAQNDDDVGV